MTEKTKVEIAQDEYAEARQNIVEYIEDTCQKTSGACFSRSHSTSDDGPECGDVLGGGFGSD